MQRRPHLLEFPPTLLRDALSRLPLERAPGRAISCSVAGARSPASSRPDSAPSFRLLMKEPAPPARNESRFRVVARQPDVDHLYLALAGQALDIGDRGDLLPR